MRMGESANRGTVYIVPTKELLNLMRSRLELLKVLPLDLKELFEYTIRAWLSCGNGIWVDRCTREGRSSSYVEYVRRYIADDLFNGNILMATVAMDICLAVSGEFEELLETHGLGEVRVSPSNTFRWLGEDLALNLLV